MSEAISATYDVPGRRILSPAISEPVAPPAPHSSIRRAHPLETGSTGPSPWAAAAWHVREDQVFYVPDALAGKRYNDHPELYAAEDEHAQHLRKAQRNLEDVLNLTCVLMESFGGDGDSRAVQAETVLKIAERKLNKTLNQLDRHDTRHRNLFFAYFDREEAANDGSEE